MKKKIIIIGKNSFIGANLFKSLKNKFNTKIYNYQTFLAKDLDKKSLDKFEIKA